MERLALFLSSSFLLLLFSCSRGEKGQHFVNSDRVRVRQVGGIWYVNDSVFTGTIFRLNAQTRDTIQRSSFLNGREHGTWEQFYADGSLKEIRHFQKGKKEGEYSGWWQGGGKKFVYHFSNDEYTGTCYEWAENGQLYHEANYVNGHEEGVQRAWYTNGKIKSNYIIINGRRYGLLGTKNCKNVSDSVFAR